LAGTVGSNGWYVSSPVNVTLTASDATSGVAATYYNLDGGAAILYSGAFAVSGEGSHSITFYSVDNAVNTESTHSARVTIDSPAPTTTASLAGTVGNNGWYISNSVNVTLTAGDATSGVAATYYSVDGGSAILYSGAFAVSGEGGHSITF